MTLRAIVIGHADADGHLITEQVRRNLALTGLFDVSTVVDPSVTKDHHAWTKLNEIDEIEQADLVFFVDMMFAPATFAAEATALVDFLHDRPEKRFFLLDHHPVPIRRLAAAKNLRAIYRPDVFDVTLGPRSGMMVVAALCENQGPRVSSVRRPEHVTLATAMRRAAAIGGPLPGQKLLALLRSDYWSELAKLGTEDPKYHHLPRGRRPPNQPTSQTLKKLGKIASQLLEHTSSKQSKADHTRSHAMSYDFDVAQERFTSTGEKPAPDHESRVSSKDLEALVTLLELAALSVTTEPEKEFSLGELVDEARNIAGEEFVLDERDVKIVMEKASFVRRSGGKFRLR